MAEWAPSSWTSTPPSTGPIAQVRFAKENHNRRGAHGRRPDPRREARMSARPRRAGQDRGTLASQVRPTCPNGSVLVVTAVRMADAACSARLITSGG